MDDHINHRNNWSELCGIIKILRATRGAIDSAEGKKISSDFRAQVMSEFRNFHRSPDLRPYLEKLRKLVEARLAVRNSAKRDSIVAKIFRFVWKNLSIETGGHAGDDPGEIE